MASSPAPAPTLSCGEARDAQAQLPHVVIFPFMAKSHTLPLTDLAHLLRRRQLATVTFLTTPGNAAFVRAALAGAEDNGVAIVELPFAGGDDVTDPGAPPRAECVEALDSLSSFPAFVESVSLLLRPQFEEALAALRPPASAVVADAFLYWAHAAAAARGVPTLDVAREVFLRDNPASLLTRGTTTTTPDAAAVFTVPEFPDVQLALADIPFPFNDPETTTGPMREMDAKIGHAIATSHGLIVNSFDAMEARYIQHWNRHIGPRACPVGPLCLARTAPEALCHGDVAKQWPPWMRWLDEKAAAGRAVLYVALGTTLAVAGSELREVADGLDRAGPPEWVDQRAILAHECVKGFLSHAGWNSVLESIGAGVPLAVWPMGAEQPLNAKLGVGIGVPPKSDAVTGMMDRSEQIARVTGDLMTGETGAGGHGRGWVVLESRGGAHRYVQEAERTIVEIYSCAFAPLTLRRII